VPPFDSKAALKNAEKAIKQGRVDLAIAEYIKVVEAQPRDWNSANALGDLYVRAKQIEKGVQQYIRIADHLAEEGFYPKAAALYKKILKIKPDDEYSMLQSGDMAAKLGTLADAKQYFNQVAERRNKRGDKKGATEIAIRLGTLDPEDYESRMRAAKLATESGDTTTALREYKDVAGRLEKKERYTDALVPLKAAYDLDKSDDKLRARLFTAYLGDDPNAARPFAKSNDELKDVAEALTKGGHGDAALEVLAELSAADPTNIEIKAQLALAYVSRGDLSKAKSFLSPETAGANPALWLTIAEIELRGNRLAEGKTAVMQAMKLDSNQTQAAVVLGCKLAEVNADAGYQPIEAVAARLLRERGLGPWSLGVVALEGLGSWRHGLVGDLGLVKLCSALRGRWVELHETAELLEPYGEWAGLAGAYLMAGWSRGLVPGASADRAHFVRSRAA